MASRQPVTLARVLYIILILFCERLQLARPYRVLSFNGRPRGGTGISHRRRARRVKRAVIYLHTYHHLTPDEVARFGEPKISPLDVQERAESRTYAGMAPVKWTKSS
jgi:hypothetical protein